VVPESGPEAQHGGLPRSPLLWPSGEVFGTICVLDSKPNDLGALYNRLIERNEELAAALSRIKTLEGILSTCQHCKKIRRPGAIADEPESWIAIETYLGEHSNAQFSHGICPDCLETHYSNLK